MSMSWVGRALLEEGGREGGGQHGRGGGCMSSSVRMPNQPTKPARPIKSTSTDGPTTHAKR